MAIKRWYLPYIIAGVLLLAAYPLSLGIFTKQIATMTVHLGAPFNILIVVGIEGYYANKYGKEHFGKKSWIFELAMFVALLAFLRLLGFNTIFG